nr:hypothetical protein [Tanacetum cinerariifolium]
MSSPTFAETHNLVTFLEKPTESDGFQQIVDFLNANPIKYALTVSHTIYTSCIKQFWTFSKVKTVNDDVQLQALVDRKKVIVNEASIRHDLRLDDAEGTACLPNDAIFEGLARMGNAMASAIICLADNQKFNFSKYILENMVNNLEAGVKFYMFPRFVQVFVNHQLGDMSHHKGIFVNPSLTKKLFANMKSVGTGFFGVITPLFETMMVQAPEEVGNIPTDTQDMPILTQPSSSQPRGSTNQEGNRGRQLRVLSLEQTKTNQAAKIEKLKKIVKKLKGKKKKRTHGLKRLYKVRLSARVESSKDEEGCNSVEGIVAATTLQISEDELTLAQTLMEIKAAKPKAKGVTIQELSEFRTTSPPQPPQAKDKGKGIMVELEKPLKKKDQITLDEEVARKLEAEMKAKIDEEERLAIEKNEAN